ncbi:Isoflavone reductase-like protein TP7 [Bienertia sinuspersici]
MGEKSKILVIGSTGNIGKFMVEESTKEGHPTFVLIRPAILNDPTKSKLISTFQTLGVQIIQGDMYDHESLVKAIKQVDVVISVVGGRLVAEQFKLIAAIKEAGNVKRFIPSHFGSSGSNFEGVVQPAAGLFEVKGKNMKAIEAEGIPHTYIACNGFAGFFVAGLSQVHARTPPRDKVVILGDGNVKGIFNDERDIAIYTIKAVDDPRTLNKVLHIRPSSNMLNFNELVSLWEKKIGKTLEKTYTPEDQILQNIRELPFPQNIHLSIAHAVWVKGIMASFEIDPSLDVDAIELYPEVKYTTMDEYLDQFA